MPSYLSRALKTPECDFSVKKKKKTSPFLKEGVSFRGRPSKKKENKEKKGTVLGFDVIQEGIKYETVNKRECTRRARKCISLKLKFVYFL